MGRGLTGVSAGFAVSPIMALPADFETLLRSSRAEGFGMLRMLHDEWSSGANRFDLPGEALVEARGSEGLAALGGLNRDPYCGDPSVGRLRRVYVAPPARRRGVGRALVLHLLSHARRSFQEVRLRTSNPEADRFFRSLGFTATPADAFSTHALRLPDS